MYYYLFCYKITNSHAPVYVISSEVVDNIRLISEFVNLWRDYVNCERKCQIEFNGGVEALDATKTSCDLHGERHSRKK